MIKNIKCVIWDLDNTLWHGILIEDHNVILRKNIVDILKELDRRGIINSIASKNHYEMAMKKLGEFHIDDYFLYPQINWSPKSESVKVIATNLNMGIDSMMFIDDSPFERDEVQYHHPKIICTSADSIENILNIPELNPSFITEDSQNRRKLYQSDILRNTNQQNFMGTQEDFLYSLNMKLYISSATESDLARIEELTVRTHQMNTTGYTYSYKDLCFLLNSNRHDIYIASLEDKYGSYGKIGLCLIEHEDDIWKIKLLITSCRVISKGIGSVMVNCLLHRAQKAGVQLFAEFIPTEYNRMMYILYKFFDFYEVENIGDMVLLKNNMEHIPQYPGYLSIFWND